MAGKNHDKVVPLHTEVPVEELVQAFADMNEFAFTHYQNALEQYQAKHLPMPMVTTEKAVNVFQMAYIWNMLHAPLIKDEDGGMKTIHEQFTELAEAHEQYPPPVIHGLKRMKELQPDIYRVTALVNGQNDQDEDILIPMAQSVVHDEEPVFIPAPDDFDAEEEDWIVCFGYPVQDAVFPLTMPVTIGEEDLELFEQLMNASKDLHGFDTDHEILADPAGAFYGDVLIPYVNEEYDDEDLLDIPLGDPKQEEVDELLDSLRVQIPDELVDTFQMMWQSFCLIEEPSIRNPNSYAAATVYELLDFLDQDFKLTLKEAASLFDATPSGMKHARMKIQAFINEHYDDDFELDEEELDPFGEGEIPNGLFGEDPFQTPGKNDSDKKK
ncbi:hypothetical protein [Salisediminibacterium selenitireducens]|uniref:Uncharacterized protein n=1 Tax=Bacillus selenitireducens (strain ATCC 700615 / DSM 15326 / MLS10) TaxID=439292 RepID=D6Y0H4_BACIE|nr:hypothetical protein [Salisediminibacterium selenitireducens]ADH98565.1 hypothetical protein Bsel_1046 [[Bacillus] selenitireducens MLS10]